MPLGQQGVEGSGGRGPPQAQARLGESAWPQVSIAKWVPMGKLSLAGLKGRLATLYWGAPRRQPWPTSLSQALGEPRWRAGCLADQAALLLWSKMELELWFLFLPRNGS